MVKFIRERKVQGAERGASITRHVSHMPASPEKTTLVLAGMRSFRLDAASAELP